MINHCQNNITYFNNAIFMLPLFRNKKYMLYEMTKMTSQMLQNSSIIGNTKPQVAFFVMAYVFCLHTIPRNEKLNKTSTTTT